MRSISLGLALILTAFSSSSAFAAWHEAKSKHFVIYANQRPEVLRAFATRLEKFDKAVRFVRGSDDPPLGDAGRLTVYVLNDAEAVSKLAVGRSSPIAGLYIPRAEGSVAFVPKRSGSGEDWDLDAETVFFHEYAHHLMLQNSDAIYPAWLVEGFAEFFSTAQFHKDGSVKLGTPADHRAFGLFRLDKPPVEKLLNSGFDSRSGEELESLYGWGWLLTHYLTFDAARRGQLAAYLAGLQRGQEPLPAATAAFGDLKLLYRDLDGYLRRNKFTFLRVDGSVLAIGPIEVRPLRPGEAAMAPIRIRSERGVNAKTAPRLAADARSAAVPFPSDPAVQATLAEAEFDAGNYAAAEAAADRALAVNPNFARAIIYKGKARMEMAQERPDTADWKSVRALFAKANRLDPEDAEPLMLFYQSYGAAGEQATKNAVDGLHYALLVAPQDPRLRIMAVGELVSARQFAEARRTLAPLAFSPHPGGGREQARNMMEALGRSDAKAALRAMAEDQPEDTDAE